MQSWSGIYEYSCYASCSTLNGVDPLAGEEAIQTCSTLNGVEPNATALTINLLAISQLALAVPSTGSNPMQPSSRVESYYPFSAHIP